MYKKGNKRFSLLNIILTILAIFIIIFILCWLAKKGTNASKYNEVFKNNLNTMHETSKEYFANDLPSNIGESKILTLEELNAYGLSDKLYYGNVACDTKLSYISITKISDTEYQSKTSLVCGDKVDSITEKIEHKSNKPVVEPENEDTPTTPVEEKEEDTPVTPANENNSCSCGTTNCVITREERTCKTTYEYEYVSYSKACPSGYTEVNGSCQKAYTETTDPIRNYTDEKTVVTDAIVNTTREYVPAIIGNTDNSRTVNAIAKTTREYVPAVINNKNTTTTVNAKTKTSKEYAKTIVSTENVTNKVDALSKTNKVYDKNAIVTNKTTSCSSDYKMVNGVCTKYANKITVAGKTVDATKKYTEWGNPTKVYTVNEKEKEYVNELEKKVLLGSRILDDEYIYTYAIYNRKASYSCSQGKLDGTKCIISTSSTKCPDGYKDNGSNCVITKTPTTTTTESCKSGYTVDKSSGKLACYKTTTEKYCANSSAKLDGNYCVTTTAKTTYSCPAGTVKEGTGANTKCYNNKTSYYCENASATLDGSKCYIPSSETTYSCPAGTVKEGTGANTKCYKNNTSYYCENASAILNGNTCYIPSSETTYSCPADTIKEGTGVNTKCYKNITNFKCADSNDTLEGNKCYKTIGSSFSHLSCKDGFTLNSDGTKCERTGYTYASFITTRGSSFIYSTATSMPGYIRTGVKKYITRCS